MNTIKLTECAYCNHDVPDEGDYVPESNDDDEWMRLADYHADDCEWVYTHAHRVESNAPTVPACTCTQRLYGVEHGVNCPLRDESDSSFNNHPASWR